MDKLISLQRAIDAVHKNYDTILDFTSDGKTISSSIEDILSELPSAEPESISEWKKEFREYVDSLDIARDDWKGIIEYIDELPSIQPDTTIYDSNEVKKGENDEDRTSSGCISRTQAIDALRKMQTYKMFAGDDLLLIDQAGAQTELMMLPSVQPERKTGRWEPFDVPWYRCSECGAVRENITFMENFCPNCGADMRGEKDG